jgi:hypothetical protein
MKPCFNARFSRFDFACDIFTDTSLSSQSHERAVGTLAILRFERRLQRSQLVGIHQLFSGVDVENLEAALINTGLQPGATDSTKNKPFQQFACEEKPLKRLIRWVACNTRLKRDVNETSNQMIYLPRFSGRHIHRYV